MARLVDPTNPPLTEGSVVPTVSSYSYAFDVTQAADVAVDLDGETIDPRRYLVTPDQNNTGGVVRFYDGTEISNPVDLRRYNEIEIYRNTPISPVEAFDATGFARASAARAFARFVRRVLEELADRTTTHAIIHIESGDVRPFALIPNPDKMIPDTKISLDDTDFADSIQGAFQVTSSTWNPSTKTLALVTPDGRDLTITIPDTPLDTSAVDTLIKAVTDPLSAQIAALPSPRTDAEIDARVERQVDPLRTAVDGRLDDLEDVARDFQDVDELADAARVDLRGVRNVFRPIPGVTLPVEGSVAASSRLDVRVVDHDGDIDEAYTQFKLSELNSNGIHSFTNQGGEREDNNQYAVQRTGTTGLAFRSDTSDQYDITVRETEPDATPRVRIDGTTITRDAQGRLMSAGGTGGGTADEAKWLDGYDDLPDPSTFAVGDLISHAGAPWVLAAGAQDRHIHHGVLTRGSAAADTPAANYLGDLVFSFNADPPGNISLYVPNTPTNLATATTLYVEYVRPDAHHSAHDELVLTRTTDTTSRPGFTRYSETSGEADRIDYTFELTFAGKPFSVAAYSDSAHTTPVPIVANTNRWLLAAGTGSEGPQGPPGPAGAPGLLLTQFTDVSPTLTTTNSANDLYTASVGLQPTVDLDLAPYSGNGEFHISAEIVASSTGSDANFGFEQNKANQTAEDRTAETTAILFASRLRAATQWASLNSPGGLEISRSAVYSLNTLLGYFVLRLIRDTNNVVGVVGHWDSSGGNANNYTFRTTVSVAWLPSDAAGGTATLPANNALLHNQRVDWRDRTKHWMLLTAAEVGTLGVLRIRTPTGGTAQSRPRLTLVFDRSMEFGHSYLINNLSGKPVDVYVNFDNQVVSDTSDFDPSSPVTSTPAAIPTGTNISIKRTANRRVLIAQEAGGVIATQAEMEAGTEPNLREMSPLNIAQAIAALAGRGEQIYADVVFSTGNGFSQRPQIGNTGYEIPSGSWTAPNFTSDDDGGDLLLDVAVSEALSLQRQPKSPEIDIRIGDWRNRRNGALNQALTAYQWVFLTSRAGQSVDGRWVLIDKGPNGRPMIRSTGSVRLHTFRMRRPAA